MNNSQQYEKQSTTMRTSQGIILDTIFFLS